MVCCEQAVVMPGWLALVRLGVVCSEMAPPQLRGRLNQLFQIILTFAIFAAQVWLAFQAAASHMHLGQCPSRRHDTAVPHPLLSQMRHPGDAGVLACR